MKDIDKVMDGLINLTLHGRAGHLVALGNRVLALRRNASCNDDGTITEPSRSQIIQVLNAAISSDYDGRLMLDSR